MFGDVLQLSKTLTGLANVFLTIVTVKLPLRLIFTFRDEIHSLPLMKGLWFSATYYGFFGYNCRRPWSRVR